VTENVLIVKNLQTAFDTESGRMTAVDGVSFTVPAGKTVGIVGESGCGKSVTAMSIVQLLPQPAGVITGGEIIFKGKNLIGADDKTLYQIRGNEIGVIFQEPMTALNPVHRIGKQLSESLILHKGLSKKDAWSESIKLLEMVGIPSPEMRVSEYPHQLSGGMRQRVVIAIALACKPDLIIADEPTTALDVTVQAQILDLLNTLQKENGSSVILITHDLGVIAETCDEVVVMYAGRVVEQAPVLNIFKNPQHAYTRGLLASMTTLDTPRKSKLKTIPNVVSGIADFVPGCRFCQRMERTGETIKVRPDFIEIAKDHWVEACPLCTENAKNIERI
jgi:peptide/nickel transport system ATP-binding protein